MITIIHGADISSSRKYFLDEKIKHQDANFLSGEKLSLTELMQIFDGGGLFEDSKVLFIENFYVKKKSKTEFAALIKYLEEQNSHNIYIWEGKELDRSSLAVFKSATAKIFKLPQSLFLLLDSLKPGNGKILVKLFHQASENADTEMIFFMLIRQIRLLIAVSDLSNENVIDELKRIAPWQKTKLQQQARLFTQKQLLEIYDNLFKLELGQKTGALSSPLIASIDFLLLKI